MNRKISNYVFGSAIALGLGACALLEFPARRYESLSVDPFVPLDQRMVYMDRVEQAKLAQNISLLFPIVGLAGITLSNRQENKQKKQDISQ
jgi:hypothetical protein